MPASGSTTAQELKDLFDIPRVQLLTKDRRGNLVAKVFENATDGHLAVLAMELVELHTYVRQWVDTQAPDAVHERHPMPLGYKPGNGRARRKSDQ